MALRTVSRRGQITLGRAVLAHLGVSPGDTIRLDLLPDGRAVLAAEEPSGSWRDVAGILAGKTNGARLSIEEIGEATAEAGSGGRSGGG